MRGVRVLSSGAAAGLMALGLLTPGARSRAEEAKDPLALEIDRWSAYARGNTSTDEMWTQVKQATEPALARAADALRDRRRLLALNRLAAARLNLSASVYLGQRPPEQLKDTAGLEAEWKRMGGVLRGDL